MHTGSSMGLETEENLSSVQEGRIWAGQDIVTLHMGETGLMDAKLMSSPQCLLMRCS